MLSIKQTQQLQKLIVVAPETDHIFSTDDAFEVDEVLAVNSHEFIDVVKHVSEFNLSAAYPNPFNPTTNIDFSVSEAGYASVKVYNLMGQVVGTLIDGMVDADTYESNLECAASFKWCLYDQSRKQRSSSNTKNNATLSKFLSTKTKGKALVYVSGLFYMELLV